MAIWLGKQYLGQFQSTPPARGATGFSCSPCSSLRISIHAPRKGSDIFTASTAASRLTFQSTPPARGATLSRHRFHLRLRYFNPRPPQGERLSDTPASLRISHFNPRPPQGERQIPGIYQLPHCIFQSTPPARGATRQRQ